MLPDTASAALSAASLLSVVAAAGSVAAYIFIALPYLGRAAWPITGILALVGIGLAAGEPNVLGFLVFAIALPLSHIAWLRTRPKRPAATEFAPTLDAPPDTRADSAFAGGRTRLGRYRLERELGRGSMGTVYLGNDPALGRRVALKTMALSREFAGVELQEARERFFREAEMAGRLRHPDIVAIHEAGEDQDLAFIAMEYVEGHDLLRHTVAGRLLPVRDVLQVIARVATALAYAHTQGVVHRDIKPANILIDPATDTVKVADFGIARFVDANRTRTGMVLGTPSFMSPEQMAGRRVDGRSDLYSVGVMLFQLLTGHLPHASDSMATLMHDILNTPAPDVRTLRPDLPEALAHVVTLALEKRPETRYADGTALAADLAAVAAQLPGTASLSEPVTNRPIPGPASETTDSRAFAATVKLSAIDPRHNPGH